MRRPHPRRRSRPTPAQLSLPLDYSLSARAGLFRNRARSKAKRKPWPQVPLATNPAMPVPLDSVLAAWVLDTPVNSFRQPQRFVLTPTLSTLIDEANGNRWPYVATLPPFLSRAVALASDRCAHVG